MNLFTVFEVDNVKLIMKMVKIVTIFNNNNNNIIIIIINNSN
jgi:hypothetical protein